MSPQPTVRCFRHLLTARRRTESHFLPNFFKPLPFAVIVAENVNRPALPEPAMQLVEEFTALRLGDLRIGRAFAERAKGIQTFKLRKAEGGGWNGSADSNALRELDRRQVTPAQFGEKVRPGNEKRIVWGNLLRIFIGPGSKLFRFAEQKNGVRWQVIEQRSQIRLGFFIPQSALRRPHFLQNSQLATGWQDDGGGFLARNFVKGSKWRRDSSSLPKNSNRTGHGPVSGRDVKNAAAEGNFPLLRNLGLRFVSLCFEPLDQLERIDLIAALKPTGVFFQVRRGKGLLQQGGGACHNDRNFRWNRFRAFREIRATRPSALRHQLIKPIQSHQRFQPVTEGVGVGQCSVLRQNLPGRVKQRRRTQPGLQVLVKTFLGFEVAGDDNDWTLWAGLPEQGRQKRPAGRANAGAGQHSAIFQTPGQGLHSGNLRNVGEPRAGRRGCRVLRQARKSRSEQRSRQARAVRWRPFMV